jgi:DNA-binding CsgD family transcriptional regulator
VPAISAREVSDRLRVTLGDADAALRALAAKGFAGRVPGSPHCYRATPPRQAFRGAIHARQAELRALRESVTMLARLYEAGDPLSATPSATAEPVELVSDDVAERAADVLATATAHVWALMPPEEHPWRGLRTPAGVAVRLVYPRRLLGDPDWRARVEAATGAGAAVRLTEAPTMALLLVDRLTAVVPVRTDRALVVRAGGLRDALVDVFERTWATAEAPAATVARGQPGPDDLRLLGLLLDGLTDEAIAGRLDLGTRTVQRRVRELIELAGVRTRLQLIWHATRCGWI